MAAIGTVWGPSTWADDIWGAGTWADAARPQVPSPTVTLIAGQDLTNAAQPIDLALAQGFSSLPVDAVLEGSTATIIVNPMAGTTTEIVTPMGGTESFYLP